MLLRGIALKSIADRSRSLRRRPFTRTSAFCVPVAPKPRMSTVVCAPFTAPKRFEIWIPGSRARMSIRVALGERSISAELIMLEDAPVMMVPETMPPGDEAAVPCAVTAAGPGTEAGAAVGLGAGPVVRLRAGGPAGSEGRRGPGAKRVRSM